MNDGSGESGRDYERAKPNKRAKIDDFPQKIAKVAVAQVCESEGFQGFQQSALNTLSDVAVKYISYIGKAANSYANLAGRTESNVFDVIHSLEDLGAPQGFSGASDVNHCLAGSSIVREITHYASATEVPFAYSIPSFPVSKEHESAPSFAQVGQSAQGEHIPLWLPAFPDPQTYSNIPSQNDREVASQAERIEPPKEQSNVERSLLACNGPEVPTALDPGDVAKAKVAADSNPFLAAPLRFGEKEVSPVGLPPRLLDEVAANNSPVTQDHFSVLEAVNFIDESMKRGSNTTDRGEETVLGGSKFTVRFKLGVGKKGLGTPVILQDDSDDQVYSCCGDGVEKDDEKKRAEQIRDDSAENAKEMAQL